jgi:hypothetical protein
LPASKLPVFFNVIENGRLHNTMRYFNNNLPNVSLTHRVECTRSSSITSTKNMKTLISTKWSNGEKNLILLTVFLLMGQMLLSSSLPAQIGFVSKPTTFLSYVNLGYTQFTTVGLNHILFTLAFFLLSPTPTDITKQAINFTACYLAMQWLTIQGIFAINAYIGNSLVLLSVFFIAMENIFARKLKIEGNRQLIIALSGMVHGAAMGNSILALPGAVSTPNFSFLSYSAGLLLGEIAVLAVLFLLIGKLLAEKEYYKKLVVTPVSLALAAYSIYGVVQLLIVPN